MSKKVDSSKSSSEDSSDEDSDEQERPATLRELKVMSELMQDRIQNLEERIKALEGESPPLSKKAKRNARRCKKCWRPYADPRWKPFHKGATNQPEPFCTNTEDKHPLYDPTKTMPRWKDLEE